MIKLNVINVISLEKKVTSRHALGMMRTEFYHRYKISSDIFIDAMATKTIFEDMSLKIYDRLNGFIQTIGLNPFGFLLFSEIQVVLLIINQIRCI